MELLNKTMLGAIVGDIIGSPYEFKPNKDIAFEIFKQGSRFTDDTVMTLAVARWLMEDKTHNPTTLIDIMTELGVRYPKVGYGSTFAKWLALSEKQPYNSWGNGSGMRVSPIGLYAETLDEALSLAAVSAMVTHNHKEGVRGAQAIAACMFLARKGKTKDEIREYVTKTFHYDLNRNTEDIRPKYKFDVSCQGSVPESILAFLEGNSFEEIVRIAVSLGGDADTMACMAGAIASCVYEIPEEMIKKSNEILTPQLLEIKDNFMEFLLQK